MREKRAREIERTTGNININIGEQESNRNWVRHMLATFVKIRKGNNSFTRIKKIKQHKNKIQILYKSWFEMLSSSII